MKNIAIAATILTLVACKNTKEVVSEIVQEVPKKERTLLFTSSNEEQWWLGYYDDNTASYAQFGDTLVVNEEMAKRDNQDGLPISYYQISDEAGFYFELENSSCTKDGVRTERSVTIYYGGETFQGCVEGKSNKTNYQEKWNLVNIPGMDNSRIYGMMNRPYVIVNQEEESINGNTGCNIFNGNYKQKGKGLIFGDLMMTKKGCNDMDIESAIISKIGETNRIERNDIKLFFYNGDDVLLEYRISD